MNPELQEFIDQAAWCRDSVRKVAEMLPTDDAELDRCIAETTREFNSIGFMFLVYAALSRERPVHAHHLVGGARLIVAAGYVPQIAFRVQGDMPEYMIEGLQNTVMYHETEAVALGCVAIWCDERRGGVYPDGLLPLARALARRAKEHKDVNAYLIPVAVRTNDEPLLRQLKQNYKRVSNKLWDEFLSETRQSIQNKTTTSLQPILETVPEEPTYGLDPSRTIRRAVARIGRNDPCHCGSGKKYKNCHYESDRERLQLSSGVSGHTVKEVHDAPERHLTLERLQKTAAVNLARMDPLQIPRPLLTTYFMALSFFSLDRAMEFLEKLGYSDDLEDAWIFTLWVAERTLRKDIGDRLMKLREPTGFTEDQLLQLGYRLLLAQDDPAKSIALIEEAAQNALKSGDPADVSNVAYSVAFSKYSALGILLYRAALPFVPPEKVDESYEQMQIVRERLKLAPDDPIYKVVQANTATAWEEAERALRETEERFEAKRREVRTLNESLDHVKKELAREKSSTPDPAAPAKDGESEERMRALRQQVKYLETSVKEKNDERNALQHRLEQEHAQVEALQKRVQLSATANDADSDPDHENDLLLPQDAEANHPLRLIEFPRDFQERLNDFPHHVGRAAMVMLGRLAGGDSAAFNGAKRLKSRPNIVRQRIGIDFRLLFRLLPDRIQVIDLIPRQDFERKIKTLI